MSRRPSTPAERQHAVSLYASGMSAVDVARTVGAGASTIQAWARAAGVSRPRHHLRARALLDLYAGTDPAAVSARHGVPLETLEAWREAESEHAYKGGWVRARGVLRPTQGRAA